MPQERDGWDRFDVFAGLADRPAAFPFRLLAAVVVSTDQELLLAVPEYTKYPRTLSLLEAELYSFLELYYDHSTPQQERKTGLLP